VLSGFTFREVEYFGSYSPKTTQNTFINSGLTNISEGQSDSFTAPHRAVYRRRNGMFT